MKKSLLLLFAMMFSLPAFIQARDYTRLNLTDVDVSVSEGEHALTISMTINPAKWKISVNRYVTLTPVIRAAADSLVLPSVTIAGHNMYYNLMRNGQPASASLLRAGHGKPVKYQQVVPLENWMTVSDIDFTLEQKGCCGGEKAPAENPPLAHIDLTPAVYNATLAYMEPVAAPKPPLHISGKAYVVFPVNQTYIDPMYMVAGQRPNIPELGKITSSIDSVKNNPDATVNSIKLTGYASPEGPYSNNVRLARERTEAVKEYVRGKYEFPSSIYHTASVPEDWEGLRDSVAVSILPDREKILEFIDDTSIPIAVKNDRLRASFPRSYEFLLKNVYPWLRHTNYDITYTIREYDDINEIMKVMATAPRNLSLREFYLAASSLPVGSKEYDDIWLTAVLMYPEDPLANINAAYSLINRGDLDGAERHLRKAGVSTDSNFAMGILEAKRGNYDDARDFIGKAGKAGHKRASEALAEIDRLQKTRDKVTYTFEGL